MCGIVGFLGSRCPSENRQELALESIRHRGPDSTGLHEFKRGRSGFGCFIHTRLSILDLGPSSSQPLVIDQGVLAYNGELFNYKELRSELESLGVGFQTAGDTEVVARAIAKWGVSAFQKFEGMWALAWFDESTQDVILARDRFGEKPLFFLQATEGLYFGSEVKALIALSGTTPKPDYDHLLRYMINGYKSLYKSNSAFFQGVSEVKPGSFLTVTRDGVISTHQYWSLNFEPNFEMTFEEAAAGVRDRLIASMEKRLRADVDVAFMMSGGVDSNSLIAISSRVLGHKVQGFTVLNKDERYEEADLVQVAARELNVEHHSIQVETDNFLGKLRSQVIAHDSPISTISYYAHNLLMEQVSKFGFKVSISGTGADELFSGYYDHHLLYFHELAKAGLDVKQAQDEWRAKISPWVRNPHLQNPDLYLESPDFREHIYLNCELFSSWSLDGWSEPFVERKFASDMLRNRMLNELFEEAVPVMLKEDDLNAMASSIENRSPFLDSELAQFAYTIPTPLLVRGGLAKAVLRRAMMGLVPPPILNSTRKIGFNASISEYLNLGDKHTVNTLLEDSPIFDLINRDSIRRLLGGKYLRNSESKFLFNFLNAKFFLEEFNC